MNSSITVQSLQDGELVVDSRLVAEKLGIQHKNFLETARKYQEKLESRPRFGHLRFQTETVTNSIGAVNQVVYILLTEVQATLLMTFSRNTPEVVEFKLDLVEAFDKAKKVLQFNAQSDGIEYERLKFKLKHLQLEVRLAEINLESKKLDFEYTKPIERKKPTVETLDSVELLECCLRIDSSSRRKYTSVELHQHYVKFCADNKLTKFALNRFAARLKSIAPDLYQQRRRALRAEDANRNIIPAHWAGVVIEA